MSAIKNPIKKVEHTLNFIKGEFDIVKDDVFSVWGNREHIIVGLLGSPDNCKLVKAVVLESESDAQYYKQLRDYVGGVARDKEELGL